jgi:hypothetical protein
LLTLKPGKFPAPERRKLADQSPPVNFLATVIHDGNQQLTGARHVITRLDGYRDVLRERSET